MRTNITTATLERIEEVLRVEIDAQAQQGRTREEIRAHLLTAFCALKPRQAAAASRVLDGLLQAARKTA